MLLIRNENLIRHVAPICKCNTCRYMYIRKIKVGWGLKWSCVCPPCSDSVDLLVCCLCDHAPDTIAHLRATTPVYIIHVLKKHRSPKAMKTMIGVIPLQKQNNPLRKISINERRLCISRLKSTRSYSITSITRLVQVSQFNYCYCSIC